MSADDLISTEELELLKEIVDRHERFPKVEADELRDIIQDQAYLLRLDEARALHALESMLPSREDREEIVAVAQELAETDKRLSPEERQLVHKIRQILNLS
jgi:tellurite resistance protein